MAADSRRGSMGAPPSSDPPALQPTLRVMRLYKPRLAPRAVMPSTAMAAAMLSPPTAAGGGGTAAGPAFPGGSCFALSGALKLPDSFGNIYHGEVFTAYISVLNSVQGRTLGNVEVSAKLQSPNDRVDLTDRRMERGATSQPPNPAPELGFNENVDMVVEHRLKELGTHTLRVTVAYTDLTSPDGAEPKFLRKFYKFNVLNPINLSMTCLAAAGKPASPLVELQLRNTTQMDLVLESCDFLPEEGCVAELIGGESMVVADSHGAAAGQRSAVACRDAAILLRPDDSYQLAYRVRPPPAVSPVSPVFSAVSPETAAVSPVTAAVSPPAGGTRLGQVELTWRTTMGEAGSVLTGPVVYDGAAASRSRGVDVVVEGLPPALQLGRLAACAAAVTNRTDRPLHLQLQFRAEAAAGVYVDGRSFFNLGELLPGQCRRCPLRLLPLVAGLHEVRGAVAVDMRTAQEYPLDKLCDVLVEAPVLGGVAGAAAVPAEQ